VFGLLILNKAPGEKDSGAFRGLKCGVSTFQGVSLKTSTVVIFVVPFKVSQKNMTGDNVLF